MRSCVAILALVFFAVPAIAETYSWVDDRGTVNFSEDLGSIPKKHRKNARVLGDEEPAPSPAKIEKTRPVAPQHSNEVKQGESGAPVGKADKNAVYGGKDAKTWRSELETADANVKAAERQLVDYRSRLNDISGMSRSEYLNLQSSIKIIEGSVLDQRKKLEELRREAETAGVPQQLLE